MFDKVWPHTGHIHKERLFSNGSLAVAGAARQSGLLRLRMAFIVTASIFFVEVVGGILSNSLALLADAAHMLTDISALGLSLFAMWIARRPATSERTFGYYRIEILIALLNGLILWAMVTGILYEAWKRWNHPPNIQTTIMMFTALIGLGANIAAALLLSRAREVSLNIKSAFLHVISDMLGSLAALTAAVLMRFQGWLWLDAAVSVLVAGLILVGSIQIIREALHILMEGTPRHIDLDQVRAALLRVPGVLDVHDLHVWTVTTGVEAMSGHAVIEDMNRTHHILRETQRILRDQFNIHHVTIQLECCDMRVTEPEI